MGGNRVALISTRACDFLNHSVIRQAPVDVRDSQLQKEHGTNGQSTGHRATNRETVHAFNALFQHLALIRRPTSDKFQNGLRCREHAFQRGFGTNRRHTY